MHLLFKGRITGLCAFRNWDQHTRGWLTLAEFAVGPISSLGAYSYNQGYEYPSKGGPTA